MKRNSVKKINSNDINNVKKLTLKKMISDSRFIKDKFDQYEDQTVSDVKENDKMLKNFNLDKIIFQ
jgi:hypothetical protein